MNKSFWGVFVVALGISGILFITFFQSVTNSEEHNSQLIKEVTEAAMWDAVDYDYLRNTGGTNKGIYKINREKFVENFVRRFAENASKGREYKIEFMDINEMPPKVSVRVSNTVTGNASLTIGEQQDNTNFKVTNDIDAILETPY